MEAEGGPEDRMEEVSHTGTTMPTVEERMNNLEEILKKYKRDIFEVTSGEGLEKVTNKMWKTDTLRPMQAGPRRRVFEMPTNEDLGKIANEWESGTDNRPIEVGPAGTMLHAAALLKDLEFEEVLQRFPDSALLHADAHGQRRCTPWPPLHTA